MKHRGPTRRRVIRDDPSQLRLPLRYFVAGPHGYVEVDYTVFDGTLPVRNGWRHPDPQHWHDVRLQCFDRDGWRCTNCNADWPLRCHHRTYANWGAEALEDVTTLCVPCHESFHAHRGLAA